MKKNRSFRTLFTLAIVLLCLGVLGYFINRQEAARTAESYNGSSDTDQTEETGSEALFTETEETATDSPLFDEEEEDDYDWEDETEEATEKKRTGVGSLPGSYEDDGEGSKSKSSGSKKSTSGKEFDPEDHDIESYYEDNRDEFDSLDDASDAFEDDEDAWDDY